MKRTLLAIATGVVLSCTAAHASLIGFTNGPDDEVNPINFFFENDSTADILNLSIDGTTAIGGVDVFWDSLGLDGDAAPDGGHPVVSGVNTPLVNFAFDAGAFITGFTFNVVFVDPDFGGINNTGVAIQDLIGVTVTAHFADNKTFVGQFVDDDSSPQAGLKLEGGIIPLPAGLPLMLAGIGALGIIARRRRHNA